MSSIPELIAVLLAALLAPLSLFVHLLLLPALPVVWGVRIVLDHAADDSMVSQLV